ncbi:mucin-2-like [Paralichthys olivaceus]|uniref:mucin-2-like n=1 Tax=Paralichthys olivaceus TaxID=8255 RepID=UPI003751BBDF
MAISKNGLAVFALLVTLFVFETWDFSEFPCLVSPELDKEEQLLPHTRQRRNVLTDQWKYIIDVEVNASDAETFELIRSSLNATGLPIQLDNQTVISDISITTVCSSTGSGFQCRCEEQFAWPYSTCVTYGACERTWSNICNCINAIPPGNQSCQPISALLTQVEYEVEVELNVTDVATVDYLRSQLNNNSFFTLGPAVNVTNIDITTVCYPNGSNFQCRCEDQYVWSSTDCATYGACDEITNDTCSCINSIPSNGRYCQPKTVVQLYEYIVEVEIHASDSALIEQLNSTLENISFPIRLSSTVNITQIDTIFTVTPVTYEYQVLIEVITTDADELRNTLRNLTYPLQISRQTNIWDVNITTVCSQHGGGFQCRCEDDYLWPCDTCSTYGKCDGDTNNTCSCIKSIPTDGQYCQSRHNQNLTLCPLTTTAPPVEYLITFELNISDVGLIDPLRTILSNLSYPISINHMQISEVNISTVCSPSSGGYQCRCEDQYRWSCDQCVMYGSCDNITSDTCGCISAIPPDGQYCQPVDQYNFTSCPVPTTPSPTTSPVVYEYIITIELNTTDVSVIDRLRNISYPLSISNNIQVSGMNISTVCSPSSGGYQCRCEDQYRWSCDQCVMYGSCDNITSDTCGCISAIPPDGQYCQPVDQYNFTSCPVPTTPSPTTSPVVYEYIITIELNTTDVSVIDRLRNISYPLSISNNIQVSGMNISTVCSPSSGGYQCRCEDQYRWSCDQCVMYGSCDNITSDTCGCISAIPPDGQYCQPVDQYNFTSCPVPTTPSPTTSPVVYEYIITIELNTTDVSVIDRLRNISYPLSISNNIQVSGMNISTVCSPSSGGYQCRCEDQYRWSCDQCVMYGSCDNITSDTCGCISAIPPDGQYCQPVDQYNFTSCPVPTTPSPTTSPVVYEYIITIELNTTDVSVIDRLRNISYPLSISNNIQVSGMNISTVCSPSSGGYQCRCEDQYRWSCDQCVMYGSCDNITSDTCGCISAIPPDGQYCQPVDQYNFTSCPVPTTPSPTTSPVVYEYIITIELNTTDVSVIDRLRNISYPLSISNNIQVSGMNISTVCSPSSGGYQCRCEDQYRWSCDQCVMYGSCDNITSDTCGCISAIPPDGQYCQPVDQYNFTSCPVPTTPSPTTSPVVYEYIITIELNTTDVSVIDRLRNISYPLSISNNIQVSGMNISTVCSPSSGGYQCRCEDQYRWSCDQCVMYGSCDNITSDTCGCISAIPPDGQYCQPVDQYNFTSCPVPTTPSPTTSPVVYEYIITIELNTTDVSVIDRLRNISYPLSISNNIQVSGMNISTVCSPSSGGYQCRCEDQYRWSCDQCVMYGSCDNITSDTCGCISAIPPDGQYCQPVDQYNFTSCPVPTTPSPTTSPVVYEYIITIELNTTDVSVIDRLRNISYPLSISNNIQVSGMNISTVCSPSSGGYQCRCEDQYRWSCDQCVMYGSCDNLTSDTCGCISAIPPDGQYCQPVDQYNFTSCPVPTTPSPTTSPVVYEYIITIELNTTDVSVIDRLRNISYPLSISNNIQVSGMNISTVCSPSSGGYQCRFEDQYRWSCDQCVMYGSCDNLTSDTCGCISAIPPDVQYCQPVDQYNFTSCPVPTTPSPTTSPVVYEYIITIELNTTDVSVIDRLRNISYPLSISNNIQVSGMNISTVCSPSSGGYQCRCEDQYRWSCDQCVMYGSCDNLTSDTCGCISAIPPDGQYCQPVDQYNFTSCPVPTTPSPTTSPVVYEYIITIELNTTDVSVIDRLRNISYPLSISNNIQVSGMNISTVCSPSSGGYQCRCEDQYRWSCDQCVMYGSCDNITSDTCGCISAIPPDGQYCQPVDQYNFTSCPVPTTPSPTTSPVVYEYIITIELNTTDVSVIDRLRNISYPLSISNNIQVSGMNISTVCSPSSGGYQCRCEDQYRWSCDQCVMYGSCDNITSDTCGCISAIPPDGQYCQPLTDVLICPSTTPPIVVTTTDVNTTTVTTAVTNSTPTATTHLNTTTAATPTVTNSTSATTYFNTSTTVVTNSTPTATTHLNTTTAATPTVTNSTSATTDFNTTTITSKYSTTNWYY